MIKVSSAVDCSNSPKNQLVHDLTIALASGDREFIEKVGTADILWNQVGRTQLAGLDALLQAAEKLFAGGQEIIVQGVISHGRARAANGVIFQQGDRQMNFCHMVTFRDAKGTQVKEIVTYLIET